MPTLDFNAPGPVAAAFMRSEAFVRGIRGPVGSAKTSSCCVEIFRRSAMQAADAEGIRPSRWAITRNTQPELKTTTIKSWLDWFPENIYGKFNWAPPFTHRIRVGDIDLEAIFLALDNEDDIKKLFSLELTGGWMNEARFQPKLIADTLTERVGRFPSKRRVAPSWSGLIMDTNAMDPDHWWPMVSGETPIPSDIPEEEALMLQKPDNWEFFVQPPAMFEVKGDNGLTTGWRINPDAENLQNLPHDYYTNMIGGKTRSHILRNIGNALVVVKEGKAVFPSFSETVHLAATPLPIIKGAPVYLGQDFGLTPATLMGQNFQGRWMIQRELVATSSGAKRHAGRLKRFLADNYPGSPVHAYGDPAGDHRAQTDEDTPFLIFRAQGIEIVPAPSNDPVLRIEAMEDTFRRLVDGRPGILIDPACRHFRKACAGGYHYPRIGKTGEMRFAESPLKNESSHIAEAGEYLMLGAGEGRAVTTKGGPRAKPSIAKTKFNTLNRLSQGRGRYR